jgi:hypothetical protein
LGDAVPEIWQRLIKELAQSSPLDLLVKLLAALILLALILALKKLGALAWPHLKAWWLSKRRLLARIRVLEGRLDRGLGAVARIDHGTHSSEGTGLWLTKPIERPWTEEQYRVRLLDSIPIWVLANSKGGVAKTTNACNLAAHYAMLLREAGDDRRPVLLLDFDYQGSASSMGASAGAQP